MPILNYTTTVPAARTVGEVQALLAGAGASAIMLKYEAGLPVALAFRLTTAGGEREFALPCRWREVQAVLRKQRVEARFLQDAHALNVSWRILKDWVAAQLAIVQAGLVQADEVFLPYLLTAQGATVYEQFTSSRLLGAGQEE